MTGWARRLPWVLLLVGCCLSPDVPADEGVDARTLTADVHVEFVPGPSTVLKQLGACARACPVPLEIDASVAGDLESREGLDLRGPIPLHEALGALSVATGGRFNVTWEKDRIRLR